MSSNAHTASEPPPKENRGEEALRRFLFDRHFDVAHVHHLTGLSTGALAVLREHRIPTVMTLHDYWTMCPRGQMWHRDGYACESVSSTGSGCTQSSSRRCAQRC